MGKNRGSRNYHEEDVRYPKKDKDPIEKYPDSIYDLIEEEDDEDVEYDELDEQYM